MIKAVIASTGLKGLATLAGLDHGAAVDALPMGDLQRLRPGASSAWRTAVCPESDVLVLAPPKKPKERAIVKKVARG